MEIQPASLRDLGSLRRLESVCFEKDAWSVLDLVAVLSWSEVIRLKAVVDGEMIGFIAGDPRPAQNTGWIAKIIPSQPYERKDLLLPKRTEKSKGRGEFHTSYSKLNGVKGRKVPLVRKFLFALPTPLLVFFFRIRPRSSFSRHQQPG